ncbi:glucose-6-phosphate dehydrogenase [Lichenicoccus sp.]|uniref:glucose-6-phosphate dehydrogenase n=1 Tax=Lichenicoccus sp. TaxID=2781899 RepID=UPI003D1228D5
MSDTARTASNSEALAKTAKPAPACTMVIFGANGDLTKRLLMPALYNLSGSRLLDDRFEIVGVDRDASTDEAFQDRQQAMMESFTPAAAGEFAEKSLNMDWWGRLHYMQGDFTKEDTFVALTERLKDRNAVFYLAVADRFFSGIVDMLHQARLTDQKDGSFRRVVIEKPFGHDLQSAKALNADILSKLDESQLYRIDHFLGKETVQNIMSLRFSNGMFEPLWNRDHIDSVQITAAETVGVEKRGKFYEVTGALRDMVPNHMFQLLAMTTMEPPNSFDADAVRTEKAKVIDAIQPMTPAEVEADVVRGQYTAGTMTSGDAIAYTDEPDVAADSKVETFIALKLAINNWRWAGVPFYLRTGKHMSARTTEIVITFKQAPTVMFRDTSVDRMPANIMVLHLQPHEGIAVHFNAKRPGQIVELNDVRMDFRYDDFFALKPSTGYETLIYDVLIGDPTLFNRADNIEAGWKGVQPILDAVANGGDIIHTYAAGTDGPEAAAALLSRDGRHWKPLQ